MSYQSRADPGLFLGICSALLFVPEDQRNGGSVHSSVSCVILISIVYVINNYIAENNEAGMVL